MALLLCIPLPVAAGLMIAAIRKHSKRLRFGCYLVTALAALGSLCGAIYFNRLPIDGTLFGYLGEFVLCGLAACGYGILLVIFLAVGFCQRTKELTNRR